MNVVMGIAEAANRHGVTPQAIYIALRQKKLKAKKDEARWVITLDDLEEYKRNKYSRLNTIIDGEPLFDNEKGFYSTSQAAQILGKEIQHIYYAIYKKRLNAKRKGWAWVVHMQDIQEYKDTYLKPAS